MKLKKNVYCLLAFLIVGNASLQAQSSDPFGEFNPRDYKENMTINAQVQQNGAIVTNALVAVYCGEELRGKKQVGDGTDPNLVFLSVYGDNTGSNQYLYFKVYTNGVTFTYNPDPAIVFSSNGTIGTKLEPHVITLPVSLANADDNSDVLTTYNTQNVDVVLTNRTIYKDGYWNTLCLPFNVTISSSVLAGADVRALSTASFENGTLTLYFTPETGEGAVTELLAGTPYIIKWTSGDNLVSPVFTDVTINTAKSDKVCDLGGGRSITFTSTFSPIVFDKGTARNDILFLGGNNNLYYPDGEEATTINTCRGYFTLNGITAGDPDGSGATIKRTILNFGDEGDATEIETVNHEPLTINQVYDLSGRRLDGVPTAKGVYIVNGRKVVIK